jgi:hypothetical protein
MLSSLNSPASDPFLADLLRAGRAFDLFYGEALLSDHLPMALTALRRLGAADADLLRFRERYAAKLEAPRFAAASLPARIWPDARGQLHLYPALRTFFDHDLETRGRDAVLSQWIPRLISSAGVDAFHGLIRTALAVESGVNAELACGLGYWTGVGADIPVDDGPRLDVPAREMFEQLRIDPAFSREAASLNGMFGDQLMQLAALKPFRDLVKWRGPAVGLRELAQESARIYLGCGHFFALHMVTGSQAVHCLIHWCKDQEAAADALWISLAAAYIIIGRPQYEPTPGVGDAMPSRDAVLAAALQHDDEHIAKLAFSAFREHEAWGLAEHRRILLAIADGTAGLHF